METDNGLDVSVGYEAVTVEAPSRLHLGFVDLNGSLGRRFGSLGLGLEGIATRVKAERASSLQVEGPEAERVESVVRALGEVVGFEPLVNIQVTKAIPPHIGLGSGTQVALAVGMALKRLLGWDLSLQEISEITERGARSGMGMGAFCKGGFFVDGGKGVQGTPPPILAREPFPSCWRVLLVFDDEAQGLHGKAEKEAFDALPPFPEDKAGHLARLVLMRILPALQEWDIESFGRGIGELQAVLGEYFAPAQGGTFISPRVAEVMHWLEGQGIRGVGQSSWGPTAFAFFGDARQAERFQKAIGERFREVPGLRTEVLSAARSGAWVREYAGNGTQQRATVL